MKRIIMLCCLVSGCATYPDYSAVKNPYLEPAKNPYLEAVYNTVMISPSIAPDGVKSFTAVGYNKMPSYTVPGETLKQAHLRMIATALAKQNLCMSGYDFIDTTVVETNTVYRGVCK